MDITLRTYHTQLGRFSKETTFCTAEVFLEMYIKAIQILQKSN